ncbi:MAG: hypothetical protein FWC71_06230 [Defluviitaleaceae bacterium]|nr:hypothetical protein [Defluviitaleaceae bacterium]
MIVPPDMDKIKKIAADLEADIQSLEEKLKHETCEGKIGALQVEIRAKGLTQYGYQRILGSRKYN